MNLIHVAQSIIIICQSIFLKVLLDVAPFIEVLQI